MRWLLPLASLASVLVITLWDVGRSRSGPGPLHPVHAALADLDQGANCEGCHEQGAGLDVAACNRCHTPIAEQRRSGRGLHGRLDEAVFAHCERCHSEHHGDEVPLITAHAFPRAGVPDPGAYDHAHVDFLLHGAHRSLACSRCHQQTDLMAAAVGARFLGLSQQCKSCHDDVHRGAFGGDCERCHGQEKAFTLAPGFRHAALPLTGAHAKVKCVDCHPVGGGHEVAALERAPKPVPVRACGECHEDPHVASSKLVRALRFVGTGDCARCHESTTWIDAAPTPAEHAALGFDLPGDHAAVACNVCHGDGQTVARWSLPAPKLAQCAVCHDHPHSQPLLTAARAANGPAEGCADCHLAADADFAGGRMSGPQHAATGFRLDVPHADVACNKCHDGASRERRFPGRDAGDCRACHQDVHRGQFDHDARYAQCTACHVETRFRPAAFGVAAHAATKFALTGAHDAVVCTKCHTRVDDGVRAFAGTGSDCAGCHADVHRGLFDRAGKPRSVDGRTGCERCHDTTAFAPVAAAFDHATWTGHPLVGAHAPLQCTACHARVDAAPGGLHLGKAKGRDCATCHADPHAGQLALGGATDCARCHGQQDWRNLHFDHQRDSRFPLDATHTKLACGKCHLGYQAGVTTIVRYKPLGRTCGDCHQLGPKGEVRR